MDAIDLCAETVSLAVQCSHGRLNGIARSGDLAGRGRRIPALQAGCKGVPPVAVLAGTTIFLAGSLPIRFAQRSFSP